MIRPGIREYFRLRAQPAAVSREVEEEIQFHLEQRVRDLIAEGLAPEDARAEAERRFGELSSARLTLQRRASQREYRLSMTEWLRGLAQDFSYSARSLAREPLVGVVIIGTLALGIGANAAMFGIIDELLLRGPAHVANAQQMRRVYFSTKSVDAVNTSAGTGYVAYDLLRQDTALFAGAAAYHTGPARVGRGAEVKDEPVGQATWDMFPLLGVTPALGRFYTVDEDHPPKGRNVAVLDWGYWQREFGNDRNVIGREVVVDDTAYTVIGVAPRGFTGPERSAVSIWLPMSVAFVPASDWARTWNAQWLSVIVRVRDRVDPAKAERLLTPQFRAAARAAVEQGLNDNTGEDLNPSVSLAPLHYNFRGKEASEMAITRWLLGVSLIVLLVSCANVANLLLARALRRRREVGVRLALGISRARLSRLLLAESLLLATAGGIAALAIMWWGGKLLRTTLLPDVAWNTKPVNADMLLYAAAAIVLTGMVVGLAPMLQARRYDLSGALRGGAREGGGATSPLRSSLTIVQAALSVLLLIGAGLFVRSLWNVRNLDLGIDADRVMNAYVSWIPLGPTATPEQRVAEQLRRKTVLRSAAAQLRQHHDIENAAVAVGTPFGNGFAITIRVPGFDSVPRMPGGGPFVSAVGENYFATAGTRLIRGRAFTSADRQGSEAVVIVNATMARTLWPDADPLTKCVEIGEVGSACARVVGIVEDARRRQLREEPAFQYYIPFGQEVGIGGTSLLIRPRPGATARVAAALNTLLPTYGAGMKYVTARTLQERIDPQVRPWRLGAAMFCIFGLVALVIAATGLFSVIAYNVAQRRSELSIRMALGARASNVVAMIVRQGVGLAIVGVLAGILLALLAGRRIEPLLFDVSARDLPTYAAVAAILVATAVLACVVPGVRAKNVNPADVLRAE